MLAADEATFEFMPTHPLPWTLDGFTEYVRRISAGHDSVALAVTERDTGRVLGTSSYLEIRPSHRTLEIGMTWITLAAWGSAVNPEMKLLMLGFAFESLGCVRVAFKTDLRNERSQRAIARLGAVREGVLRNHMLMPDGYRRATVLYSITDDEWPGVKAGLERRLAGAEWRRSPA